MKEYILDFISHFTQNGKLKDVERCFTDGCCYWFAVILANQFGGKIVYDEIDGHFATKIDKRIYDITGDVTDTFRVSDWYQFCQREPILSMRILRRCKDFEEVIEG